MVLKVIPRPKPASSPEVIEFLRELLITAYLEDVQGIVYAMTSTTGRTAHGVLESGVSSREVDRMLDMLENWASDFEFDTAEDDEEEDVE